MDIFDGISPSAFYGILTFVTSCYFLYKLGTKNHDFFRNQGIDGPKPIPFFGNLWGMWNANLPNYDRAMMSKYGKICSYCDGTTPILFTTDSNMIRSVFIKHFDHFINRRDFKLRAKVFRMILTDIRDQVWKDVRSAVSPTFTTGSIKRMSLVIEQCAEELAKKLKMNAINEGKMNVKTSFSAFTIDVIARSAFGMTIEGIDQEGNTFYNNAVLSFNPPINKTPLVVLPFAFPYINQFISDRVFLTKEFQYFIDLLTNLVKERAITQQKFYDFIELTTEAIEKVTKAEGSKEAKWNKEEVDEIVAAQSMLFLLAGFDTTAATLTNTAYLLAKNQEVQEKLYKEIMKKVNEFGKISHEAILDMPYLDQVINEVLRFYPPLVRIERECRKDITIDGIYFKKGSVVIVPVAALHSSEEYYPNPEVFDPERWTPENRANRSPYVHMPFGTGPRNCIGMRFAFEQMKIALSTILQHVRFYPTKETPEKLEVENGFLFVMQPSRPIVGIGLRQEKIVN